MTPLFLFLVCSPQLPILDAAPLPARSSDSLSWFDLDGDGDRDLLLVDPQGTLRILRRGPGDVFEEALVQLGIDRGIGIDSVLGAQPGDWDGDGLADLMVYGNNGVRLFRQSEGVLVEATDQDHLANLSAVSAAFWIDVNGDELPDLHVVTAAGHRIFANEAAGCFRELTLGLSATPLEGNPVHLGWGAGALTLAEDPGTGAPLDGPSAPGEGRTVTPSGTLRNQATASLDLTTLPTGTGAPMPGPPARDILNCVNGLADQAGGACIQASRVAVLGQLFPYPGENNTFAPSDEAVVAGGRDNAASGVGSSVGGGRVNTASGFMATVGGGLANSASLDYGTVSGGFSNGATGYFATVGGGRGHEALGYGATIGGGVDSHSTGTTSTVGGGVANDASGNSATIGGGQSNEAASSFATVSGGSSNHASAAHSTVSGGRYNTAAGDYSTVIGGGFNAAYGNFSVSGGQRAKALHDGAFVWSDTAGVDFSSTAADQFLIRASGGVGIGTNAPQVSLHVAQGTDVSPIGGGYLQAGNSSGTNIAIDSNEIMARNNSSVAELSLNVEGGDIILGGFDDTGRVGIGDNSPSAKLDVFGASTSDVFRVRVDGTTRLVLDGNGTLGVGANFTPTFDLQISASAPNGGTAAKPGGGSWSNASDRRLKKNIEDLEGALDTLLRLRGVTYEYKDPQAIDELAGTRIGFIAQEVERVLPDWVGEKADGMKMLTVRGFEALAVEALRELEQRHTADLLEQRSVNAHDTRQLAEKGGEIARLTAENEALAVRLSHLESFETELLEVQRALAQLMEGR